MLFVIALSMWVALFAAVLVFWSGVHAHHRRSEAAQLAEDGGFVHGIDVFPLDDEAALKLAA